ncbi:MAG: phosphonate ABC transporter, permease protein PhnE, partial [Cyanobacteria bacterium P01_D01_bin.128]
MKLSSLDLRSASRQPSPKVKQVLAKAQKRITPLRLFGLLVAIAVLIYSGQKSDLSFGELFQGSGTMVEYISRYFPPDFNDWRFYMSDILETIGMGVWGTIMAAVVAVPLSIMSAENVAPLWLVFP